MKKVLSTIAIAGGALAAGAVADSMAKTARTTENVNVKTAETNAQVERSSTTATNQQSQPKWDEKLRAIRFVNYKPFCRGFMPKQKPKKHTNRLRCSHNAKLKRRR